MTAKLRATEMVTTGGLALLGALGLWLFVEPWLSTPSKAPAPVAPIDPACREKVVTTALRDLHGTCGPVVVCDPGQWIEAVEGANVAVCRCGPRPVAKGEP